MVIHVQTVGTLKSLKEGVKIYPLQIAQGSSVSEVIRRLNLKEWEIGIILINGAQASKETRLKENDILTIIAPLAGG